jgi:hypothetical protein
MGLIKDPFKVNLGIDLFMKKVESAGIDLFRDFVWKVFCEILNQTPQWSGKAVANWNIGVGAPDFSWDDNVGDHIDAFALAHERGDEKWKRYARERNKHKLKEIHRREKVFITNAVWGDTDHGKSSHLYLESLQDPAYWTKKLRVVNQPYEIATETMIRVIRDYKRGIGISVTRAGGDSFDR